MRPRKPIYCKSAAAFERDFALKFGDRRVLKTAFHFFDWATKGERSERDRLLSRFTEYCRRRGVRASWRNAAEWNERGRVEGVGA